MSWVKAAQTLKAEAMEELIKQLTLANMQAQTRNEEANQRLAAQLEAQQTYHKEALALQQENTRLLAAQQATQQGVMQAQVTALKEAVQQLSQVREQAAVAPGNQVTEGKPFSTEIVPER